MSQVPRLRQSRCGNVCVTARRATTTCVWWQCGEHLLACTLFGQTPRACCAAGACDGHSRCTKLLPGNVPVSGRKSPMCERQRSCLLEQSRTVRTCAAAPSPSAVAACRLLDDACQPTAALQEGKPPTARTLHTLPQARSIACRDADDDTGARQLANSRAALRLRFESQPVPTVRAVRTPVREGALTTFQTQLHRV